jgi:hypothetical protein
MCVHNLCGYLRAGLQASDETAVSILTKVCRLFGQVLGSRTVPARGALGGEAPSLRNGVRQFRARQLGQRRVGPTV